ncbi:MAG: UDP-N-acetylmuramoyl-L-alanyl-D-glutamate--2,6-diaminopimelate ligase [Alistipes indistinctus]|uniref:UDP-N-acetylmuramoyl-L-alanyl-D-glutamate--2, 6-diaminopimelate ligase n=3 Tax=Alistipes indistinctus TaxID=626932 RepID=UPI00241F40E4|nr:UDP-N-acetylmuramoyl-L-alanyl-D-glutamate--2,6-diaminopimelate ligase [Alistipes indistinctus]MBD9134582.1 UDP-N-acetylmuramoyl-L-alanyl-D-glutamate--2,6-diaminopimelate ligase [Alistipes indistinctus]
MRMLDELLQGVEVRSLVGDGTVAVGRLEFDSRKVVPGTLFFATRGTQTDGHAYIPAAVAAGAAAVVCEELPAERPAGVTFVQVPDSTVALGQVASAFYGHPSRRLKLVGVTGTNGKTTTATLLYRMFRRLGYKAGLISTVVYCVDDREIPSTHTTPDSIRLNAMMAEMVEAGCDYCFMEVSSHSLVQHRTAGLAFVGGIFSNITHDHLDYHKTFAEYIRAKKLFFDGLPAGAFALTNADDRNGMVMVQNTKATVKTYALQSFADFRCRIVETLLDGMLLNLDGSEVWVKFLGRFNAYNLTSVYATALLLDARRDEVLRILSDLTSVDGRFEPIHSKEGVTAIVDYAHTPDALQNVIGTINEIRKKDQRLYVVVGCGGNRDATKRPEMAKIAVDGSDMAVLTSDNPRLEKPGAIIEQMKSGLEPGARYLAITDRREAIKAAVALARPGDIILVAGKGHETYQDVGGVKHHFDDREEVRAAFGTVL